MVSMRIFDTPIKVKVTFLPNLYRSSLGWYYLVRITLASRSWILARCTRWVCDGDSSFDRRIRACNRPHLKCALCRSADGRNSDISGGGDATYSLLE